MKNIKSKISLVSLLMITSIFVNLKTYANVTINEKSSAEIVNLLLSPANPTGLAVKAILNQMQSDSYTLLEGKTEIKKIGENSYEISLSYLSSSEPNEGLKIFIDEVTFFENNQSYVFSFKVYRFLLVKPSPGVSIGSR